MKIDLVSRYFKPLKYSENVIRYVPKLPPSLFCCWWLFTAIDNIFFSLYLQYSSPFCQEVPSERILSSFRQSFHQTKVKISNAA